MFTVIGFISNVSMFVVATGLLGKYSEVPTSGWAAAAVTFLFLYVFWCAIMLPQGGSFTDFASATEPSLTRMCGSSPPKFSLLIFAPMAPLSQSR